MQRTKAPGESGAPLRLRRRDLPGAVIMNVAFYPLPGLARAGGDGFFARRRRGGAPPPLPGYDLTQTAYRFGPANHLEALDQRGLKLPAGASALPAVTEDWFQLLFFSVDEMLAYFSNNFVVASKDTTGHAVSGAAQTGLNVHGGLAGGGQNPFTVGLEASNAALRTFFPGFVRAEAIDRGAAHLAVWGQKGDFPFFALVRLQDDGRHVPMLVNRQVGGANNGVHSWKYAGNGTTAQYAAGAYDFLSGFGGNVDVADGGNRRSAGGSVGGYVNVWGSFPFSNSLPDEALLMLIANGAVDGVGLAATVGGTLRYANHLRGPGDLGGDPRGAVQGACTEIGTNANAVPARGSPLRQTPELRLKPYGDRFVFPMTGTAKTGAVPFTGQFSGRAAADSFEARLVRADSGADLVPWTPLAATVDNATKRYSASLPRVPAGVGFRREIRWRKRPQIVLRDGDRQGIGLLVYDVSQSQLALQGYASNTPDTGGGASLAPTQSANAWMSILKQPFPINAQNQGGGPLGNVALFQPYAAGQHGDGNIHTYEAVRRLLGVPVMFVDGSAPGTHPNRWTLDRQGLAYSTLFTPDGTTTVFSFTPASAALQQQGQATTNRAPGVVPGTLAIQVGAVTVTDDGVKNLVGAGVTGGTINYETGAIVNLTFAAAPAAGVVPTGTFRHFAVSPENVSFKPETGAWSMFGDANLGLNRANQTGRTLAHLRRLRGVSPSLFRVFWYTAFEEIGRAHV